MSLMINIYIVMKVAKVKDHYTDEEFKKLFSTCKNDAILYNRLVFIRSIKNGNTIKETAKILDIDARTGSRWLKRYNEMGIDGLKPKFELRGSKCKLSDEQLTILEEKINEEGTAFTIKKAQKFISENFSIEYSYKQVWEITRKKLNLNYGKPFLKYHERPENYKEEFKKN